MSYETVATYSQVISLLLFIALFLAVLAYAYWPSNRDRLEQAQRQALDLGAKASGRDEKRGWKP